MSRDEETRQTKATKSRAPAKKTRARKAPAKAPKASKSKATKSKARKSRAAAKPKPDAKAGARLPWAEVVSRVIGQPEQAVASSAPEAIVPTKVETTAAPPTTIRFPSPTPRAPSAEDTFGPDEWVSVTYTGEEVFVHGKAGIFARGTTTHLRGKLARELAAKPGFRVRRAA